MTQDSSLSPTENKTQIPQSSSSYPSHYTDRATLPQNESVKLKLSTVLAIHFILSEENYPV